MSLIKSISIVWESSEEGGVNSYLKYLINSNLFKEKKIYIYTNNKNKGAKILEEDLKNNSNVEFKYFKSYFDNDLTNPHIKFCIPPISGGKFLVTIKYIYIFITT